MEMAKNTLKTIKNLAKEHKKGENVVDTKHYEEEFLQAINDDLNMPQAIAIVQKMLKEPRSKNVYNALEKFNQVLGLNLEEKEEIPAEIKELALKRWNAKLNKNWAEADKLRQELSDKGYLIKDSKDNYEIVKI